MLNNMDMSDVVLEFAQTLAFKSATQTVVDYKPVMTYTTSTKQGTIYPSKVDELKAFAIDRSLAYYTVYTIQDVKINDLLEYKSKDFKMINKEDFMDYGYVKSIFEEVKNA